ncbi:MAG: molecular chaperone DnaJ [Candidatus Alcyoniella australis]|nr:molecular chaperone DnaJ [Candidatus Alcyoniella australis]
MIKKDYYEVLGVARDAELQQIKKLYRELAIRYHPDRNPGDQESEERFKEASEAYQVLSDPEKREMYNRFGHEGLRGSGFQGFSGFEDVFSTFGSIFEEFFGFGEQRRGRNSAQRGNDIGYDLQISFEEAAFGVDTAIEVNKYDICNTCKGARTKPGTKPAACPTCQGTGQVRRSQGFFAIATACPQCRGEGVIINDPCPDCQGAGRVPRVEKISVKVPAGVEDGTRLRLSGKGESGMRGGPAGDLYVLISVKPHKIFQRQGNDVLLRAPISYSQAALGAEFEVPTLEGPATLRIPHGTQSGRVFKLKGKGIPHVRGYGRGDQVVQVLIEVPTKLTTRQEELLREFAEIEGRQVKKHESLFDRIKSQLN